MIDRHLIRLWFAKPLFFLMVALLVSACQKEQENQSEKGAAPPPDKKIAKAAPAVRNKFSNVGVIKLVPRDFSVHRSYIGHLLPIERGHLRAEIEGVVEMGDFEVGDEIEKDQVLLHVSTTRFRIKKDLAATNLKLAESNHQRDQRLKKKDLTTDAVLDLSQNKLEVARYNLQLAEVDLEKSMVRSPISGIIKTKKVEKGEFVNKGQKLAEILNISRMLVLVKVPEKEISHFHPGKSADITLDALPGSTFRGKVKTVGLEAESRNRSFPVELEMDNPASLLRPGMLARVRISVGDFRGQVLVPRHAVLEREKGRVVFVVKKGKAVERFIQIKPGPDGEVHVISGLAFRDQLVVKGHHNLAGNERVNVRSVRRQSKTAPNADESQQNSN